MSVGNLSRMVRLLSISDFRVDFFLLIIFVHLDVNVALSLAMSRDGSSGGVIRLCIITKDGVTREFVPGDQLPYN